LFVQVLAALVLGIVLGTMAPNFAVELKILSDAFLKLISMIVAPIVFCVVVHGIAGAGDLKKVGRVGVKALLYFEAMTTVALIVGLALALVVGPGHGMNIDPSTLDAKAITTHADNAHKLQGAGVGSFILNIIPTTSFDALARNDVLQVLFFAVIFGVSLALVGAKAQQVTSLIDAVSIVLFRAMGLIVRRSGWRQQPPSSTLTSMPSMHRSSNCSTRPCGANPSPWAAGWCSPVRRILMRTPVQLRTARRDAWYIGPRMIG
jgi:aerobic C4-dicarboxylate transport protein